MSPQAAFCRGYSGLSWRCVMKPCFPLLVDRGGVLVLGAGCVSGQEADAAPDEEALAQAALRGGSCFA